MSGRGGNKGYAFTKQLRINSSDRVDVDNTTDSDFAVDLGTNLSQVKKLSISAVQFNNVFYNIFNTSVKYNNYWGMDVTGSVEAGRHTPSIPPGYYSVATLESAIQTTFDTIFGVGNVVIQWAQSPTTNLITIVGISSSLSGMTKITFSALTKEESAQVAPGAKQDFNVFGILGFPSPTAVAIGASNVTATYFPSLNNPSVAYIVSSALAPMNSFDEGGKVSNILIPIQINVPFGNLVVFECRQDILCEIDYGKYPRALNRVDIQLVDHNLDVLDLHGTELNLDLRVWLNLF